MTAPAVKGLNQMNRAMNFTENITPIISIVTGVHLRLLACEYPPASTKSDNRERKIIQFKMHLFSNDF